MHTDPKTDQTIEALDTYARRLLATHGARRDPASTLVVEQAEIVRRLVHIIRGTKISPGDRRSLEASVRALHHYERARRKTRQPRKTMLDAVFG